MFEYRERIESCSGCGQNVYPLEHSLFHSTGVSSGIIRELGLTTEQEVENAFRNATQISKCFINLGGRRTKIREENRYLFPQDIINLIPNLQR